MKDEKETTEKDKVAKLRGYIGLIFKIVDGWQRLSVTSALSP